MQIDYLFTVAGPAELACAALLAKQGNNVLVLEPSARPGGFAGALDVDGVRFPRLLAASTGFEPDLPLGLLMDGLLLTAPVLEMEGEIALHTAPHVDSPVVYLEDLDAQVQELNQVFGHGFADFLRRAQDAWLPAWEAALAGDRLAGAPASESFSGASRAWEWLDGLCRCLSGAALETLSLPQAALALEALWRPLYLPLGEGDGLAQLMETLAEAVIFHGGAVHTEESVLSVSPASDGFQVQSAKAAYQAAQYMELGASRPDAAVLYLTCEDVLDPEERLWHFTHHNRAGLVLVQVLPPEDGAPRRLVLVQPRYQDIEPLTWPEAQTLVRDTFPEIGVGEVLIRHAETPEPLTRAVHENAPLAARLPACLPQAVLHGSGLARTLSSL